LRGDEPVHLPQEQRVLGLEQLHLGDPGAAARRRARGDLRVRVLLADGRDAEHDERHVVPGVAAHHLRRGGRPVQPLHLAAGVLDHHGRRLRRLAVAHRSIARRGAGDGFGFLWGAPDGPAGGVLYGRARRGGRRDGAISTLVSD